MNENISSAGVAAAGSKFHLMKPVRPQTKAKPAILFPGMARRPAPEEFDRPLTREELAGRERQLSLLSPYSVADAYRQAHEACRMEGDRLPRASAVQELVTA